MKFKKLYEYIMNEAISKNDLEYYKNELSKWSYSKFQDHDAEPYMNGGWISVDVRDRYASLKDITNWFDKKVDSWFGKGTVDTDVDEEEKGWFTLQIKPIKPAPKPAPKPKTPIPKANPISKSNPTLNISFKEMNIKPVNNKNMFISLGKELLKDLKSTSKDWSQRQVISSLIPFSTVPNKSVKSITVSKDGVVVVGNPNSKWEPNLEKEIIRWFKRELKQ
jgi:hypothetical protein